MARRIRVPSCQHWLVLDLGSLHVLPEASQFLDDEIRLLFEDPVAALLDDAAFAEAAIALAESKQWLPILASESRCGDSARSAPASPAVACPQRSMTVGQLCGNLRDVLALIP